MMAFHLVYIVLWWYCNWGWWLQSAHITFGMGGGAVMERDTHVPRDKNKWMKGTEGAQLGECRCNGKGNDQMNEAPEWCAQHFTVWFGCGAGSLEVQGLWDFISSIWILLFNRMIITADTLSTFHEQTLYCQLAFISAPPLSQALWGR